MYYMWFFLITLTCTPLYSFAINGGRSKKCRLEGIAGILGELVREYWIIQVLVRMRNLASQNQFVPLQVLMRPRLSK